MKSLLAFDLGTSGVKCSLYDKDGKLLGAKYGEYETLYPYPDRREQRPMDWIEKIVDACNELTQAIPDAEICGIGVSGHSLGALPVDEKGKLLTEQIPIWSDARAKAQADRFFQTTDYKEWYETTGNGFPAMHYSLFKIMWYQEHDPELYEKTAKFIGSKDFINLYLTGNTATDISYASGCGLYDLKAEKYCEAYAKNANVDIAKFLIFILLMRSLVM